MLRNAYNVYLHVRPLSCEGLKQNTLALIGSTYERLCQAARSGSADNVAWRASEVIRHVIMLTSLGVLPAVGVVLVRNVDRGAWCYCCAPSLWLQASGLLNGQQMQTVKQEVKNIECIVYGSWKRVGGVEV